MHRRTQWAVLACGLVLATSGGAAWGAEMASEQLAELFAESWQAELADDPLLATQVGVRQYNDRLPSVKLDDYTRRLNQRRSLKRRLERIDRSKLTPSEQVSYDIFGRLKQDEIAELEFETHLMPITNRTGFHISFPDLPREIPLDNVEDYENYIARLRDFARYTDEHIQLMREGIRRQLTLPGVVLAGYEEPITAQIVQDPKRSLLYKPFEDFPSMVPPEEHQRLAEAGRKAIETSVVPAYQRFLDFMTNDYVPAARGEVGASALPKGREFYRHRVRQFTTLDLEPQQVHDTGLAEVARIKAEMNEVIRGSGFKGDFAQWVDFLRTDPQFYAETPEQLMKEVAIVLKRMDGELPKLFKTLPRLSYGIREVPKFIAPQTTTAYYSPGAGDGSRAGFYYVNTYNLKSRPLYEIEALSLHEAVPGHHLQIAIMQELQGVPDFQRFAGFTAFVEGWALYSERLGLETGFYDDPYSNFGRLSYEMWRACRLVVDTGIHYLGWSREQAIEFMVENTALTRHNITTEVDRYIAWPGQALAYKIGELKIRELRTMAESRLGTRFDIREFHDVVLGQGAVPLEVLDRIVRQYCNAAAAASGGSGN